MNYYGLQTGFSDQELEALLADFDFSKGKTEEEEQAELMAELDKIGMPEEKPTEPDAVDAETSGPAGPTPRAVAHDNDIGAENVQAASATNATVAAINSAHPLLPVAEPEAASAQSSDRTLPDGFAMFPDGIYELPVKENAEPIFICTPLRVDAMFADQGGKGWGRLIGVKSADGRWHEIPVTNANLMRRPTDVVATMVDHGLELAAGKHTKERLLNLLRAWKPDQRLRTVNRMGWVDDSHKSFVLGSTLIGTDDVLPLAPSVGIGAGLISAGGADDWKENVGMKCRGNPLMILAVSLAFSGPLLAALGLTGGGLHFRGASSSGKTTLLNLAASVWGDRRLITQWRATSNGLEAMAAALNDMLLPLDEIAEISARDLHGAIYMLANGVGKARMTKDVTLSDQARWRLALISSGEISVEEKLKEAKLDTKTGHEVRLIDIEADSRAYGVFDDLHGAVSGASFAEGMQQLVRVHHGAVGIEFVKALIANETVAKHDILELLVRGHANSWLAKLPSAPDGPISRVAKRFAVIGAAGAIATKFGLTGWGDGEAENAAEQAFNDWYDRRYGAKREAVESFVKPLQDFLAANLNGLPDLKSLPAKGYDPEGWRDATRAYLPTMTWSKLFPGANSNVAAKALADMQM